MLHNSIHMLTFYDCLLQLYVGKVVGEPHFLVPRKLPSFWRNLWLRKRFLVMEKWDTGRHSGLTAPACDVVLKYTRWAARSDTWPACQISTQVASNNSISPALQSISSFRNFSCLSSFIFSLYFHYSVFLPYFLIVSRLSFYLTALVPADGGPPRWSQSVPMQFTLQVACRIWKAPILGSFLFIPND